MTIRVALQHHTTYRFDRPVKVFPHVVRLRPAPHVRTPIHQYSLKVDADPHFLNWQQDPFGNYLARLVFPEPLESLTLQVDLVAELASVNPFDFFLEESAEHYPFAYEPLLRKDLAPYLECLPAGPLLRDWLNGLDRGEQRVIDLLVALNQRVQQDVAYTVRMEPGVQSCEETLDKALGSCRDSAWLMVQILRHLGLAARFVSGYLVQLAPDVKSLDGPSGPEEDFTDLHAWAEVFVPGAGWIGLDPTSGLFAAEGHIPLACTPEPQSAAPITGATDRCETEFEFFNRVTRVHEDPRVTLPYSETQWQAIDALGEAIDEELQAADVRLTMGGEPTFVAIDDMESAQWNTAADGEHKRDLAQRLLLRLRQRFAPEALVHYGQGKWYPGEPLPRWQLGLHWRTDGQPVWRDSLLLADALKPGRYGYPQAKTLATELCRTLGVNPGYLMAAREDPFYYLWQEDRLPQDVDPEQADLADAAERRKLAALLRQGLDHPVGLVLPLRWDDGAGGWRSSRWPLRGKRLYLLPGDSPMGLRLPLESLPWESREQDIAPPASLFAAPTPPLERFDLAVHQRREAAASSTEDHGDTSPAQSGARYPQVIHTALCIELRDKRIHLFLPPLPSVEQYLDLVASIEATAREQRLAVVIEGYEPPRDNRMMRLLVTPDPGVIEVNIHPAASWRDLQRTTEVLYEEARQSRMGTEKFMLDGRHTGTGGGNHVTLGGPTPADSPMLRRPDLLRSLISYWQNHPSLSYVFSGLFIGPTSQAPRVDEARHENLYELEIAFQQMPDGAVEQPWLVDRLLRHLLVDITGNTHRAEFCIDKLYSPDSATGRLGLLEMRAFEMPPHPRMSLVQMLLLRALVARFWRTPYRAPLVRWGTALHDRFMLPHFLWKDLREVIEDLNRSGYRFDIAWFDPFFEFRFPLIGIMNVDGLELELRQAIEPWHVLGEEAAGQGTARYVDSSVERLQIKVRGMTTPRHVVACNGRRVPLRSTQSPGEFVAGVRYRAWQPPSALHPTIGVHTPLVFDLIDTWNGRSLGGCTYHVSHPGGRSYDTFPVNAYEAQGRRISRFYQHGHSIGAVEIPPQIAPRGRLEVRGPQDGIAPPPALDADAEYPTTLDLRR